MKAGEKGDSSEELSREELEEDEKIIVRSDGTVTYVGKDMAYQLWKFGLLGLDFNYEPFESGQSYEVWITAPHAGSYPHPPARFGAGQRVYNVIDVRQSYLQRIVLLGLRALGFEEQARNSVHFSYEMVALSPACCEELGYELSEEDRRRPHVDSCPSCAGLAEGEGGLAGAHDIELRCWICWAPRGRFGIVRGGRHHAGIGSLRQAESRES